jgi:hypothetical protein
MTPAPFFLQDSAGPRQIVCDLPMTQRGPAEEAVSNPTMRTGLDFKFAQFDQARGEPENWIKMQRFEI